MIIIKGKGVYGGYAFGPIAFYERQDSIVKRKHIEDVDSEIIRFEKAQGVAIEQLKNLHDKAIQEVGELDAQIFEIHQMMLDDDDFVSSITNIIKTQQINAEFAVATTGTNFSKMFSLMDDDYMKERATDVKDISERIIRILSEDNQDGFTTDKCVILAADDLVPSETVQLDKTYIKSFVTMYGSPNSHTAILARMMNIPAIIGLGEQLSPKYDGKYAIVDGFNGKVIIEPDQETIEFYEKKQLEETERQNLLKSLKGKDNTTIDGSSIKLFANIGNVADVAYALQNDAGGIGLFRSEFLYLQSKDFPTEEEQFQAYKTVVENMAGKQVVIRTLDIGADKQIDYFNLPKEENPALGYRAIRICLEQPEIFKTQLRALLRASAYGDIAIMFPMITDVEEVREAKAILQNAKSELTALGVPYSNDIEVGIMIETPAAVMVSDILAKEVDFFSIGTNDLTQYLLAVDRQNPKLDRFYRPHHLGLLRMIKMAADNIHKEGKWIGICGELGADIELTEMFLAIGIDELSVSPSSILELRHKIQTINLSEVKEKLLDSLK